MLSVFRLRRLEFNFKGVDLVLILPTKDMATAIKSMESIPEVVFTNILIEEDLNGF